MNEEQAKALMQHLDKFEDLLTTALELFNNVAGHLEYLAKQKGYGRYARMEMEAHETGSDKLYWNRLHQAGGEDGVEGGRLSSREQLDLPNTLTDEEKAHIAATIATQKSRERLSAKRNAAKRRRRK